MTRNIWPDVFLIILVVSAVGCATKTETKETTTDSTVSERTDEERVRYQGDAERRLAAWGARIDSLKSEFAASGTEAKAEMKQEIEALEVKRQEAARKLEELKVAGAGRWNDTKRNVADVLDELDRRFDSLRSRLRDERG